MSVPYLPLLFIGFGVGFAAAGGDALPMDPAVVAAEHQRLSGEIQQLARRQAWAGVEQRFTELVELGIEPGFDDLVYGAHAARGIGDAQGASDRLKQAAQIRSTAEIRAWLGDLAAGYGHVVLSSDSRRPVALVPEVLPFAPDRRAAVEFAVHAFAEQGRFEGLLPIGTYQLGETEVVVDAGVALQIEVSARSGRGGDGAAVEPEQVSMPTRDAPEGEPRAPDQR
ncbi:MAG: hypothetical protein ABIO70_00145 [Pseudomonadota bacterium]